MMRLFRMIPILLGVGCGGSLPIAPPDALPVTVPVDDAGGVADSAPAVDLGPDSGVAPDQGPAADTGVAADTAGPAPDVAPGALQPVGAGPFVHNAGTTLDVTTLITGGKPPYTCSLYAGPGRGTMPGGMSLNGCTLTGGFAPTDLQGAYGFFIVVRDQEGAAVELPIVVRNGACGSAAVTISPAEWPVRIISPGSAASWAIQVKDVDAPCADGPCSFCNFCLNYSLDTHSPLKIAAMQDCAAQGEVCLAVGGFSALAGCPGAQVTWSADLRLKAHAPLRADSKPGWATLAMITSYSGTKITGGCGNKSWGCHIEVLER